MQTVLPACPCTQLGFRTRPLRNVANAELLWLYLLQPLLWCRPGVAAATVALLLCRCG